MELPSPRPEHPGNAPLRSTRTVLRNALLLGAIVLLCNPRAEAETLRIATWNMTMTTGDSNVASLIEGSSAAEFLRGANADILVLEEIPARQVGEGLISQLEPRVYRLAVIAGFNDAAPDAGPQLAILTQDDVIRNGAEYWRAVDGLQPTGGFVWAVVRHDGAEVLIYAVALEPSPEVGAAGRLHRVSMLRREVAIEQLIEHWRTLTATWAVQPTAVVIAGSFNTNPDEARFVSERTLNLLEEAGFAHGFDGVLPQDRVTFSGGGKSPASTSEYFFVRGGVFPQRPVIRSSGLASRAMLVAELELDPLDLPVRVAAVPTAPPVAPLATPPPRPSGIHNRAVPPGYWWWFGLVFGGVLLNAWLTRRRDRHHRQVESRALVVASSDAVPVPPNDPARPPATHLPNGVPRGLWPLFAAVIRERLVRALVDQRTRLLDTQHAAAGQVEAMEERLARLQGQLGDRFANYETRIAELQKEVAARDAENRELRERTSAPDPAPAPSSFPVANLNVTLSAPAVPMSGSSRPRAAN